MSAIHDTDVRVATFRVLLQTSIAAAAHYVDRIADASPGSEFDSCREEITTHLVRSVELLDSWRPRAKGREK